MGFDIELKMEMEGYDLKLTEGVGRMITAWALSERVERQIARK